MNTRERFNAILNFESKVKSPKVEMGYWKQTLDNFKQQGMPIVTEIPNILENNNIRGGPVVSGKDKFSDKNVKSYFKLDPYLAKMPFDISPKLEKKIVKEDEHVKIYYDRFGRKIKIKKDKTSIPLTLEYPIKNREDFERYKQKYDFNFKKRLPRNWAEVKKEIKNRDYPLRLGGMPFGFLGTPRLLMGEKQLFLKMYDEPQLIKDINEFFLDFIKEYWSVILAQIEVDCCVIWEDMCYKSGSLISIEMFKTFLAPYYKEIVDFFKQYNQKNILVDSDGFVENLIPLWKECGITGLYPFEIQAGNDLLRIRKNFPKFQMLGGINKMLLRGNKKREKIDEELKKVPKLLQQGGYIPHIDHFVPADATWENFKYYRNKLNNIIENKS